MFDYIIVGAGLSGSVMAERIASQLKKRVLIIEQRNHIAGNCYDYYNEDGLLIHKYGPHIFHTENKQVWDYLSQFTEWHLYQHQVLASVDGDLLPIPFNLNSLERVFSNEIANKISKKLIDQYGYDSKLSVLQLRENNDPDLKMLADFVYEKVLLNYTNKQWGLRPEDIEDYVMRRVPIFISRDNRYYQDEYQGIPKHGYSRLFENMLRHPNIKIMLNTDYRELVTVNHHTKQIKFMGQIFEGHLIYTGKIDELFDFCYGDLPYRSIDFKVETVYQDKFQEVGTINYPNDYDFSRVTEMKHLTGQIHRHTAIMQEFPKGCTRKDVPYYPVPQATNLELFERYHELSLSYPNITLLGRLAEYRYHDMHTAVMIALDKFNQVIKPKG